MAVKRVGLVTIGQSPRDDLTPDIRGLLAGVELVEAGALDGLTAAEIAALKPEREDDLTLVTRLADGSHVTVAKRHIIPLVEKRVLALAATTAAVLIICTGKFPDIAAPVPVLKTQSLLHYAVRGMGARRIGVIIPEAVQVQMAAEMWEASGFAPVVVPGSPYREESQLAAAARELAAKEGIELIILDCIGFNSRMKELVREITGKPVVLPRTLAARLLAELV